MQVTNVLVRRVGKGLRSLSPVAAVAALLLGISLANAWYAHDVALPRYCGEPELALSRLAAVVTRERPAGEGPRRDYIVATKLLYLVPRAADEPLETYLQRVRGELARQCQPG